MTNIKKWLYVGVIALVVVNIATLIQLKGMQVKVQQLQIAQENTAIKGSVSKVNTITRHELENKTELCPISLKTPLVSVTAEDTTTLKALVGTKPKLVFRYSELNCMQCVDQEVANIKALAQEVGKDHIIIAATYNSLRDLFLFKRVNNLELPVYKLPEEGFGLPLEKANVPFLFILDEDFQSKLVFVPEKNLPDMSEQYYNIIKSRFFK